MRKGIPINSNLAITQTLELDNCWVCNVSREEFKSKFEEHHVVPRCYGGEKGPTVSLCDSCHTIAHETAESLYKHGYPDIPYTEHRERERCLYLATVIVNARIALENINDPNKRIVYSGFHDGETHRKLKQLAKHLGMSQPKIIRYAIHELYKKFFG